MLLIEHLEEKIHQLPPNLVVEVDNIINELLQHNCLVNNHKQREERMTAKHFLKELRPHCFIGDVISPIEEQWDVTL
jgi:hypothetical protein